MNLLQQLRREEGVKRSVYLDSLGYWTIGVGRLVDARLGGGLSDDEIDILLANDIARCTSEVLAALPWVATLDEPRRAALIGMAFQMGTSGLLVFGNTLAAIRDGRYDDAEARMLQSKWAQQTPARARRMARQIATGEWQ